ncbi:hypothetical protein [Coleofasciculus sp.]|uniref:hypothetical protein n=1 Tax=Coleofasciculus sp. TaxID=3100458 RepID=UPI0039F93E25
MAILPRLIGLGLIIVYCFWTNPALAGQLADRVAQFPDWQTKPPVIEATGDLVYPERTNLFMLIIRKRTLGGYFCRAGLECSQPILSPDQATLFQ